MSSTEDLLRYIKETQFETFDKEVVDHAKKRIADIIGCAIVGAKAPAYPAIVDLVTEWGGKEESTILAPHRGKVPTHNAAMANCILATAFDFEPSRPIVEGNIRNGHISGTTVPTALAVAEQKQAGGKALLTALILGDDVTCRILAASDYVATKGIAVGWAAENAIASFGTTAIASKLWGLDERQMHNAFGIALNQASGSIECLHQQSHCYKLNHGFGARNGVISVELASRGFTGLKDPLLGEYGYFALYCRTYHPEMLTREAGKKFYSDRMFKQYPSCGFTHKPIDCALALVRKHDIEPLEIDEVSVSFYSGGSHQICLQPFKVGDDPHMDANWSIPYTVANVLLRKHMSLEDVTDESVLDPDVLALAHKVKVIDTPPKPGGIDIVVKMKDKREFSEYLDLPMHKPTPKEVTMDDIKEKFLNNIDYSKEVPRENAEKAFSMLERLEDINNVAEIIDLLT